MNSLFWLPTLFTFFLASHSPICHHWYFPSPLSLPSYFNPTGTEGRHSTWKAGLYQTLLQYFKGRLAGIIIFSELPVKLERRKKPKDFKTGQNYWLNKWTFLACNFHWKMKIAQIPALTFSGSISSSESNQDSISHYVNSTLCKRKFKNRNVQWDWYFHTKALLSRKVSVLTNWNMILQNTSYFTVAPLLLFLFPSSLQTIVPSDNV